MRYVITLGIFNSKPHINVYRHSYNKSWNLGHLSEWDGGSLFFSHEAKLRSKAVTTYFISPSNHKLKSGLPYA